MEGGRASGGAAQAEEVGDGEATRGGRGVRRRRLLHG
uniref:Uncharacterized protein n=1 Tax=Arundo donax TaxID=35708 RepID=A0A0A8ZDS2_ARUDO